MKRARLRRLGTILLVLGAVVLAYGATVYFWRDPATDVYNRWKQHQLASDLEQAFAEYQQASSSTEVEPVEPGAVPATSGEPAASGATSEGEVAELLEDTEEAAARFFANLEPGEPLGRIEIPKLDIDPVFVNGTKWGRDLTRGPGRYPETAVPGLGRVTAIAGHRTTFGAPFRNIDHLKAGDAITLELPYGTFHYRVTGHEIVANDDWSIIDERGHDTLVLSACHPLYSASQRWIVYARLAEVELPDGESYAVPDEQLATAETSAAGG